MVTVNTVEDIIAVLQNDPELLRQVQNVIMTDRVLALPDQFAAMLETQRDMLATIADLRATQNQMLKTQNKILADQDDMRATQNQTLETQNEILATIADLRETQNKILADQDDMRETQNQMLKTQNKILADQDDMRATQNQMLETQNEILATIADLRETQNEILRRTGNLETRFRRMDNDFGNFRGNYAETAARKDAYGLALTICESKDWRIKATDIKVLGQADLAQLANDTRFDALPTSVKISFLRTDVAVQFVKPDGTICYIMAEASYTCDSRDTTRAMSHSRMVAQYTGRETFPVIAGVRLNRDIQPLIDAGDVFWYELEDHELEPEETL